MTFRKTSVIAKYRGSLFSIDNRPRDARSCNRRSLAHATHLRQPSTGRFSTAITSPSCDASLHLHPSNFIHSIKEMICKRKDMWFLIKKFGYRFDIPMCSSSSSYLPPFPSRFFSSDSTSLSFLPLFCRLSSLRV